MQFTLSDFEQLVRDHNREIFNYLWRMLQNQQDAEDALQDCFLRALRAYPKLQPGSNPRAWLFKIATNVALTQLKRRNRLPEQFAEIELIPEHSDLHESNVATRMVVMAAIDRLPGKQRAALILRYYQGLEYTQIGLILECSPESARANLYQGLKKLRKTLKQDNL